MAGNALRPWSIVLKGLDAAGTDVLPTAHVWPPREHALHRAGLLDGLPGHIRGPRCFGEQTRPDGSAWLWLEDMTTGTDERWSLERYAWVARKLGQFNGAFLVDRPLPDHAWLSRDWLPQWVGDAGSHLAALVRSRDHPFVRRAYSPRAIAALNRHWAERHRHYDMIARLPQTFCHLDAFRRNIFLVPGARGEDEIVLIDWEFAGIAGIGEELASLVVATVVFGGLPAADLGALQATVLEGYIDGLRDACWRGDPGLVLRGYTSAVALRFGIGIIRLALPMLLDEGLQPALEAILGKPMDDALPMMAAVNEWLADIAFEA